MPDDLSILTISCALLEHIAARTEARVGLGSLDALRSADPPGIDLALVRVEPNAELRNRDLPTFSGGSLVQAPSAAVDLLYAVIFRGAPRSTHAWVASVVAGLHVEPRLSPESLLAAARKAASLAGTPKEALEPWTSSSQTLISQVALPPSEVPPATADLLCLFYRVGAVSLHATPSGRALPVPQVSTAADPH